MMTADEEIAAIAAVISQAVYDQVAEDLRDGTIKLSMDANELRPKQRELSSSTMNVVGPFYESLRDGLRAWRAELAERRPSGSPSP